MCDNTEAHDCSIGRQIKKLQIKSILDSSTCIESARPTIWKGANIIHFWHVAIFLTNVFDRSIGRIISMVTIHQLRTRYTCGSLA